MSFTFQKVVLMAFVLSVVACTMPSSNSSPISLSNNSAGIIGGTKSGPQETIAKSTVIISLPNGNMCSGILLNDHVVLTAAHCLSHGETGYQARLQVNGGYACAASSSIEVARPPKATEENDFVPDLGLMRLKTPLCTPGKVVLDPGVRIDESLRVAGFGQGNAALDRPDYIDITVISSDVQSLKEVYSTVPVEEWAEIEPYQAANAENLMLALANDPAKTTCFGDSGGPVYREAQGVVYLAGVISGAYPHSQKGVAACNGSYVLISTPVGPNLNWIQETIKNW